MDIIRRKIYILIFVLVSSPCLGSAGDIVHQDKNAPKRPGCDNNFVLVSRPIFCNSMSILFMFLEFVIFLFCFALLSVWLLRKRRK